MRDKRCRRWLHLLVLGGSVALSHAEESTSEKHELKPEERNDSSLQLAPYRVNATRLSPAEAAELERTEHYDEQYIRDTGAFTIEELLERLPRGAGGERIVMIDGRETRIDLRALPLHLLERIEYNPTGRTTDGRRATGGVLNLVLKQNYVGREGDARWQWPFAGGGATQHYSASAAYNKGSLRATLSLVRSLKLPLLASQRSFSRNQDHTAQGGTDFRLPWGATAIIESLSGALIGVRDSDGNPVYTALAPPGRAAVTPGDFIPGPAGILSAEGLRRFNSARFLSIQPWDEHLTLFGMVNWRISEKVEFSLVANVGRMENRTDAPPPVTPASADTRVPAAMNPFGQDVAIGMVHEGFGPVRTRSKTQAMQVEGTLSRRTENWYLTQRTRLESNAALSHARELDPAKFRELLDGPDSQRFLPFGGSDAIAHNEDVYRRAASNRTSETESAGVNMGLAAHGNAGESWAGPLRWGFDAEGGRRWRESHSSGLGTEDRSESRTENAKGTASLQMPVLDLKQDRIAQLRLQGIWEKERTETKSTGGFFGDSNESVGFTSHTLSANLCVALVTGDGRPGLRRLEIEGGGGRVVRSDVEPGEVVEAAISWAPLKTLSFNGRIWNNQMAPIAAMMPDRVQYNQTVIDPRRGRAVTTGVEVVSRRPAVLTPTVIETLFATMDWEPTWLSGFKFTVRYSEQSQKGLMRVLSQQDLLYNEANFPTRITRGAASPADLARGFPGEIVFIDNSALNSGLFRSSTIEGDIEYRVAEAPWGRFSLNAGYRRLLRNEHELSAGVPLVVGDPTSSPFAWNASLSASWSRGNWNVQARGEWTGSYRYVGAPVDGYGKFDLRGDYRFARRFFGRIGEDLRLGLGLVNVFDEQPAFVDVLQGFLGQHAGRTLEVTLRMPF